VDSLGGTAVRTRELVQTRRRVSIEFRVRTSAHLTLHVLRDVLSQQRLEVALSVTTLQNQLLITSDRARGTELSKEKLKHVFLASVEQFANFSEIREANLLGTDSFYKRRSKLDCNSFARTKRGVSFFNDRMHSIKEVVV
jgi:hypothetical protein